jgi:antitoxin VapB
MYSQCIQLNQETIMTYPRVFQSGNSQAMRLSKEFRLEVDRVETFRRGDDIVLRERPANAAAILDALTSLPEILWLVVVKTLRLNKRKTFKGDALPAGHQHLHLHRQA